MCNNRKYIGLKVPNPIHTMNIIFFVIVSWDTDTLNLLLVVHTSCTNWYGKHLLYLRQTFELSQLEIESEF